jgi:hypothetical protein
MYALGRPFRFLFNGNNRTPTDVLENYYTEKTLIGQFVIWDEGKKSSSPYRLFDSRNDFWSWYSQLQPLERHCHEVIFGFQPQRIKFDIDAPYAAIDSIESGAARTVKMTTILNQIIDTIIDEFYSVYYPLEQMCITRQDIIVAESCGENKFSYHLIVAPFAVANNEEAKVFTARVINQLPDFMRSLLDAQVNKRTQNFRLTGSCKPNSMRIKQITQEFSTALVPLEKTLITAELGMRVLPQTLVKTTKIINETTLLTEDVTNITNLANCQNITGGHTFNRVEKNMLFFKRRHPSFCHICQRIHQHDNTLVLIAETIDSTNMCKIIESCRHSKTTHYLGDLQLSPEFVNGRRGTKQTAIKEISKYSLVNHIKAVEDKTINTHEVSLFEKLPSNRQNIYSESAMQKYEYDKFTLVVKAQMKLGKTHQLQKYISEHFATNSLRGNPIIRFVTFRQTFSKTLHEQFPDFELYSNYQGDLSEAAFPRLIVQVESLHRLTMSTSPEPIDLLILDEVESILAQFNSGLHKHFNAAFAMFCWMLATARRVICMDANVSDRTYRVLERIRPKFPCYFHWNKFEKASEDQYFFTGDRTIWLDELFNALQNGQKLVIPTNSLAEANTFQELILRDFPTLNVKLYSSNTLPSEKVEHFGDVHKFWSLLDVLIYTPTVSAGVSFELEHFDALFGYFGDFSCDVETCRQMLGRVRNISTNTHYICLQGKHNNLPTNINDIKKSIYTNRESLDVQFEYDQNGEIHYYETPYFQIWLETVRIANLSKNNFVERFVNQVVDTGAKISIIDGTGVDLDQFAKLELFHKIVKKELELYECKILAEAEDIEYDEAIVIRDMLYDSSLKLTVDKKLAYEKFRLRNAYNWHGCKMTPEFVNDYHHLHVRNIYDNLKCITAKTTIEESLQDIHEREFVFHTNMMNKHGLGYDQVIANENNDLQHKYVYLAHSLVVWLLRICGFRCITDKAYLREETVFSNLISAWPLIVQKLHLITTEFEIKRPSLKLLRPPIDLEDANARQKFIKKILYLVNSVLRKMYGRRIICKEKKEYLIDLTPHGILFPFSQIPIDKAPHIPSFLIPVSTPDEDQLNSFITNAYYDNLKLD